jgi:hypothetical protein
MPLTGRSIRRELVGLAGYAEDHFDLNEATPDRFDLRTCVFNPAYWRVSAQSRVISSRRILDATCGATLIGTSALHRIEGSTCSRGLLESIIGDPKLGWVVCPVGLASSTSSRVEPTFTLDELGLATIP